MCGGLQGLSLKAFRRLASPPFVIVEGSLQATTVFGDIHPHIPFALLEGVSFVIVVTGLAKDVRSQVPRTGEINGTCKQLLPNSDRNFSFSKFLPVF